MKDKRKREAKEIWKSKNREIMRNEESNVEKQIEKINLGKEEHKTIAKKDDEKSLEYSGKKEHNPEHLKIIMKIMETHKHTPEPKKKFKKNAKKENKNDGFVTPIKNTRKSKVRKSKISKMQKLESSEEIRQSTSHKNEKYTINSDNIFQEKKERGNKPIKIVKSLLIEGKVLYDIEWEKEDDKSNILNTTISEEKLKSKLSPELFTKLINEWLEQD